MCQCNDARSICGGLGARAAGHERKLRPTRTRTCKGGAERTPQASMLKALLPDRPALRRLQTSAATGWRACQPG